MHVAIDSYCFHRFFGEVYPEQPLPLTRMSTEDFLAFAGELAVDGVSLESCYFPSTDPGWLDALKGQLDSYGFERVYAWGHPAGLEGGKSRSAFEDMLRHIPYARRIGADVMRVVGSSRNLRHEPHQPQLDNLARWFREAMAVADEHGIKLAVENHIDYTADECLWLIEAVGSPNFGINFDTGNFVRLLDDPIQAMHKLAKHTFATHIKDLKVRKGAPVNAWYFFSSTPVGEGFVDNLQLVQCLKDAGYQGLLAVEIDHLHPDYHYDEHTAVRRSIEELRRITAQLK